MIGGEIDENKHLVLFVVLGDHSRRGIEEETIRFELARTEIVLVVEMLHTGGGLEKARAHERAERDRARRCDSRSVATPPAGRDPGDEIGKTAEAASRQSL